MVYNKSFMVLLKSFRVLNRGSINRSWYACIENHNIGGIPENSIF